MAMGRRRIETESALRAAERSFGVNHPASQMKTPERLRKLLRIGTQPLQSRDETTAEHLSKHRNRRKKSFRAGQWLRPGAKQPAGTTQ
jgi:hypothetical protein